MDPSQIITLISQFLPVLLQMVQSIIQAINPQHPAAAHLANAITALDQANQHLNQAKQASAQP